MLKVVPILALKDNYIWCIVHVPTQQCVVVDPGATDPVLIALEQQHLKLTGILVTHHHGDHTQGIDGILKEFKVPVFASYKKTTPSCTHPLKMGDKVTSDFLNLQALEIPGHTLDHTAYYGHGMVFTGDTLFTAGCGRVFEGTMEQMFTSLNRLAELPDDTLVYCGHEYTQANLKFARAVEPNNPDILSRIKLTDELRAKNLATVPAKLGPEKKTNPFLRTAIPEVIKAAEQHAGRSLKNPVEVFTVLREWKNNF